VKAVYILWLRQLKRYSRSRARMVGSLGQPILLLIALGYGLGPIFAGAGEGDYLQFLAPGIITMGILFTAVFSGIEIIWDRQFGFLKLWWRRSRASRSYLGAPLAARRSASFKGPSCWSSV
jgi:ABC-2 type transport system permease protein